MTELNEAIARKVLVTVDAGLVYGLGSAEPGQMCIEAAVCYAYGLPHSDMPPCVGSAVRSFKIRLNDSRWSSNSARANGMRRLAIAQLGSDAIDQKAFARMVVEGVIRRVVPIALRSAGMRNPKHAAALENAAARCEQEGTAETARFARKVARTAYNAAVADADAVAYATDAADATDAAADAANAAANAAAAAAAAAVAAAYATDAADAYDATVAVANAAATADDDDYDAADAAGAGAKRDQALGVCADIGLQALIALKSPGCEYLWLADEGTP